MIPFIIFMLILLPANVSISELNQTQIEYYCSIMLGEDDPANYGEWQYGYIVELAKKC
jgi:hypothetical protein